MKNPTEHNYLKSLFALHASGQLKEGAVSTVTVEHDDGCQIWKGGKCNCNPTLTTTGTTPNRASRRKNR